MFDSIGEKIKILAFIGTVLGMIGSLIAAIVLCCNDLVGMGFVVLIAGVLFSWIGSFLLYGFGELISKTSEIADDVKRIKISKPQNPQPTTANKQGPIQNSFDMRNVAPTVTQNSGSWICNRCGFNNPMPGNFCCQCGERKSNQTIPQTPQPSMLNLNSDGNNLNNSSQKPKVVMWQDSHNVAWWNCPKCGGKNISADKTCTRCGYQR